MNRRLASIIGIIALSLPPIPASAQAGGITLSVCGSAAGTVRIPGVPSTPPGQDHQCCGKACHAGCERKRKHADSDEEPDEA